MPFNMGPWQLLIILLIALLVFGGRGRIPSMMGDLAKGINAFRRGLKDNDNDAKKQVEDEDKTQSKAAFEAEEKEQNK